MKRTTSKTSTTARASRLCARVGDKLERIKCCSSGTTVAVFIIGAPLRSGWNAWHEAYTASPFSSPVASVRAGVKNNKNTSRAAILGKRRLCSVNYIQHRSTGEAQWHLWLKRRLRRNLHSRYSTRPGDHAVRQGYRACVAVPPFEPRLLLGRARRKASWSTVRSRASLCGGDVSRHGADPCAQQCP